MLDFFISHNRTQKEWARELATALRQRGFKYFFDEESIGVGEDIISAITRALETSKHVVLILSKAAVTSRWVELEWATAVYADPDAQAKRLLPILVEDCEIPVVLRRLKYLDARNLAPNSVADELGKILRAWGDQELSLSRSQGKEFRVGAPLRATSRQYIERKADLSIREAISKGLSVGLFGPRMIGKTSLLVRAQAEGALQGRQTIFFDCQSITGASESQFLAAFSYRIFEGLGVPHENQPSTEMELFDQIVRVLRKHENLAIFLDEFDLVQSMQGFGGILIRLRYLISEVPVCLICAGVLPPHWWPNPDPAASPFWNMLSHSIFVSPFSSEESDLLLKQMNIETTSLEKARIYELTGGHPWLIAHIGSRIQQGETISRLLEDPMHPQNNLRFGAEVTLQCAQFILKDQTELLLRRVARQERIEDEDLREGLWLAGVIRNPREQPPHPSSGLIRLILKKYADQPVSDIVQRILKRLRT